MNYNHPLGVPFRHHHLALLKIGDCLHITDHLTGYNAQAVCYAYAKKNNVKLATKSTADGGRSIWRID
jgi:hypothetical protein